MEKDIFINKVEASGIIAIDLADYKTEVEIVEFDIKDYLYMGLIVKEKEFKEAIEQLDFSIFKGKAVALLCSADAIIPPWVYILLADKFHSNAVSIDFSDSATLALGLWKENLANADLSEYEGKKTVIRARPDTPAALYLLATTRLKPLVKALMYGEIGMPKVILKNN